LGLDTFTVLVDKGYHNGNCPINNITTIVASYARKEAKKVLLNPNIGSSISATNPTIPIHVPKEKS
jgi:hypothetical protein